MQVAEEVLSEFAKSIELTGTKVLEGLHRSPRGGSGVEFHELRPYEEGEDSRFIDWKRFASSDRYLVRRFERQEPTAWRVWVDSSESMAYGAKAVWSQTFAGSLLYLAQTLGDSWTLMGHSSSRLSEAYEGLLARETPSRWNDVLQTPLRSGDRLVLISDFFFDLDEFLKMLDVERETAHQIVFVQTLDPREFEFSFEGVIEFQDRESPEKLVLDARMVRSAFLSSLRQHQDQIKKTMQEGDRFFQFSTDPKLLGNQVMVFFESL